MAFLGIFSASRSRLAPRQLQLGGGAVPGAAPAARAAEGARGAGTRRALTAANGCPQRGRPQPRHAFGPLQENGEAEERSRAARCDAAEERSGSAAAVRARPRVEAPRRAAPWSPERGAVRSGRRRRRARREVSAPGRSSAVAAAAVERR